MNLKIKNDDLVLEDEAYTITLPSKKVNDYFSYHIGVVPEGVKFMGRVGAYRYYMFELTPRNILFDISKPKQTVEAKIPYTQFLFIVDNKNRLKSWNIGCTKKPMKTIDDTWYISPYPNTYDAYGGSAEYGFEDSSGICWGNVKMLAKLPLEKRLPELVNQFFMSKFTAWNEESDDFLRDGTIHWKKMASIKEILGKEDLSIMDIVADYGKYADKKQKIVKKVSKSGGKLEGVPL